MFANNPSANLRGYVVWVPKAGGLRSEVADAMRTVPDSRVSHYWDGQGVLMDAFEKNLGLGEDAWDIYLVFGPDAAWAGVDPPVPQHWMHQLGEREAPRVKGPYLDVPVLAEQIRALEIKSIKSGAKSPAGSP